jgi:tetratricopeptide (TPR) repeat protein
MHRTDFLRTTAEPFLRRFGVGLSVLVLALFGSGCQTLKKAKESTVSSVRSLVTSSYSDPQAEEKFTLAEGLMQDGKHKDAQSIFADIAENSQNPALLAEKARYHEAECLRLRNKLPDAAATYNRLLKDFPFGAYRERSCNAMYAIAYGWLEEGTFREIESARNGTKASWWENGMPDISLFDSKKPLFDTEGEALKVLDNVQTHDYIGPNCDRALYWLGYVHYYRGRFEDADQHFSQLVEHHKDSKLRESAMELAIIAKQNATGGAVYDSRKASEALQLIHYAEATVPEFASDPEKKEMLQRQKYSVRMQLATKYLEFARYYERTNHPASAYFYYELVARQHPGTKPAEIARERMTALEPLKVQADADRAAGKMPEESFYKRINREWDSLWTATDKRKTEVAPESVEIPAELPANVRQPNP